MGARLDARVAQRIGHGTVARAGERSDIARPQDRVGADLSGESGELARRVPVADGERAAPRAQVVLELKARHWSMNRVRAEELKRPRISRSSRTNTGSNRSYSTRPGGEGRMVVQTEVAPEPQQRCGRPVGHQGDPIAFSIACSQ